MSRLTDFLLPRPAPTEERSITQVGSGGVQLSALLQGGPVVTEAENAKWWGKGDERGLSTSAVVRRCINAIAQPLASLDFIVIDDDGEEHPHDFATIFNKGGRDQPLSARMVKETALARMEWRGQSFLFLDRGATGAGPIAGVTPIYGETQAVVDRDKDGLETLMGYRTRGPNGRWVGLLKSEVLWLRYPDPDDPWGCVAPWTAARSAARLDRLAEKWQEQELLNGNRAAAVVYLGDLDQPKHDAAMALWNRTMVGPQSSNRAFLTSGATPPTIERLGLTPKEAAYLDTRQINHEEVALAFGLDSDYLFGRSTFENKAAAKRQLWTDNLIPKLEVIASEVDRQVIPEEHLSGGWDVSEVEALRENEDAIVERLTSLLGNDAVTIDEVRAERGMDPLPNGLGGLTLTAYRAAVQSQGAGTPADPADVLRSAARQRIVVSRRGVRTLPRTLRAQRPAQRASRAVRDEATIQRVYDRLEGRGVKAVARLADTMERSLVRNYTKTAKRSAAGPEVRIGVDEFFDATFWQGRAKDMLEVWLGDIWEEGGSRTASALGLSFDTYDKRVTAAMLHRLDLLAEQVTSTTRAVLESGVLERAAEQGLSVDDTVALMKERFADLRTWRAQAIARTETVGGFNASSRAVAVTSGVVQRRQWHAASDDRVRDSHSALNGHTTRGLDDAYPNGLMFPGDPAGPPSETVQCRCIETYVLED